MADTNAQPNEVTQPNKPAVTPEVIPDVEIGIGAGDRNKNFSSVDPSRREELPGKDEPAGKRDHLPGADEKLQ